MGQNFDQNLEKIREDLAKLSKKAADVYGDAKAACELGHEVAQAKLKDAKGDLVAVQENIRMADEKKKNRLASQMLKLQMQMEAKIEDMQTTRDRKKLENYIDSHVLHMADLYETIVCLLADAELTALETVDAVNEYNERFGSGNLVETEEAEKLEENKEEA